ncbi:heterokaryon incompatibility protein-domain-containing protein [Xylariaceae sp. FL1651]|nr:heterokaryon incompatibility protein-domain-containing protein [Xylariaceae sp. FL1651]
MGDPVVQSTHMGPLTTENHPDSGTKHQSVSFAKSTLCHQCRALDLASAIEVIEPHRQDRTPCPSLIATRTGLDPKCALCSLFASMLFSDSAHAASSSWQLRSFSLGNMLMDGQSQKLFDPIARAVLHTGDGERDYIKHMNDEEIEKRGFLVCAKSADLRAVSEGTEGTQAEFRTRFVPKLYDPALVREWIELSKENRSEYGQSAGDKASTEDSSLSEHEEFSEDMTSEINDAPSSEASDMMQYTKSEDVGYMKVIDCETCDIIERTADMGYIALSYVWRLADRNKVTLVRKAERSPGTSGQLPPSIPVVVENAMRVVREIGYQYLWVDQYCIDQTCDEELADQVSKMDLIYSRADLTIIAASSGGALAGVGDTPRIKQELLNLTIGSEGLEVSAGGDITVFTVHPHTGHDIQRSVWYTRGWCFQEAVLSRRRLYFTDHEMLFETGSICCTESLPEPAWHFEMSLSAYSGTSSLSSSLPWTRRLYENLGENEYDFEVPWHRFCAEYELFVSLLRVYVTKDLTMESDALQAFRGVMSVFLRTSSIFSVFQGIPVFGIPGRLSKSTSNTAEEDPWTLQQMLFICALTWTHDPFDQGRGIVDYSRRPPVVRRSKFPSWSWAGWKRPPDLWRAGKDPAEVFRIPGLRIRAIEAASGEIVRWSDAISYFTAHRDEPMYLIGEANVVPRTKFMSYNTWKKLHGEHKSVKIDGWISRRWGLSVLDREQQGLPESEELQEQAVYRNLDDGTWACLTMCEAPVEKGKRYRWRRRDEGLTLLVVAWQNDGRPEVLAFLQHYCNVLVPLNPAQSQLVLGLTLPADVASQGKEMSSWIQEPMFASLYRIAKALSSEHIEGEGADVSLIDQIAPASSTRWQVSSFPGP